MPLARAGRKRRPSTQLTATPSQIPSLSRPAQTVRFLYLRRTKQSSCWMSMDISSRLPWEPLDRPDRWAQWVLRDLRVQLGCPEFRAALARRVLQAPQARPAPLDLLARPVRP